MSVYTRDSTFNSGIITTTITCIYYNNIITIGIVYRITDHVCPVYYYIRNIPKTTTYTSNNITHNPRFTIIMCCTQTYRYIFYNKVTVRCPIRFNNIINPFVSPHEIILYNIIKTYAIILHIIILL